MKLSEREARILAAVELNADQSLSELQQRTGYRSHVIRYVLQKLEREKVIKTLPFVDMYPLGYQDFGLYFSLAALDSASKRELLQALIDSPFVTFLIELGGDYQYCAGIYVHHITEFVAILDSVVAHSPNLIFDKSITMRVSMTRFNRGYLDSSAKRQTMSFGESKERVQIDEIDERILVALNESGQLSHRALAESVDIPLSTFQYRLQVLKRKNVFRGLINAIQPETIGRQAFQLLVHTRGLRPSLHDELLAFLKRRPESVYLVRL